MLCFIHRRVLLTNNSQYSHFLLACFIVCLVFAVVDVTMILQSPISAPTFCWIIQGGEHNISKHYTANLTSISIAEIHNMHKMETYLLRKQCLSTPVSFQCPGIILLLAPTSEPMQHLPCFPNYFCDFLMQLTSSQVFGLSLRCKLSATYACRWPTSGGSFLCQCRFSGPVHLRTFRRKVKFESEQL